MDQMWNSLASIALAIVGIAILAVLVSKNSNTSSVISAATGGFANDLSAAEAPVTGATGSSLLSGFPSLGFTGGSAFGLQ